SSGSSEDVDQQGDDEEDADDGPDEATTHVFFSCRNGNGGGAALSPSQRSEIWRVRIRREIRQTPTPAGGSTGSRRCGRVRPQPVTTTPATSWAIATAWAVLTTAPWSARARAGSHGPRSAPRRSAPSIRAPVRSA